jgi:RNA polymerase sigma-70 factor (ECF subfamily)
VQEAYLRALNDWTHKTVPDTPLAWLRRVARNILIDYLRQKNWRNDPDLDHNPGPEDPKSKDRIHALEIFSVISSLGRKKARIIEAFYYDGMSVREIADEMNISERAVEGQLRRARQSLKSLLPDLKPNAKTNGGSHERTI